MTEANFIQDENDSTADTKSAFQHISEEITINRLAESELILNSDGSIFHLQLLPEHIADDIILVGDQARVEMVSGFFDKVEFKHQNREFITHTGYYNNKRISVISTGIGTDNVDIVINELDALVNIDLKERLIKSTKRSLNLVRLGTSGALQEDIEVDSFIVSSHGIGFDGLLNYYNGEAAVDAELTEAFISHSNFSPIFAYPYFAKGSKELITKIGAGLNTGITATATGFYGPQGRKLRLTPRINNLNELLTSFSYKQHRITNFEMETSALYGLSSLLGHNACTVCTIIANRLRKEFSKDYKVAVKKMIALTLERLAAN